MLSPGDKCNVFDLRKLDGLPPRQERRLFYVWNALPHAGAPSPQVVARCSTDNEFTVISVVTVEAQHFDPNGDSIWLYVIVDGSGIVGWVEHAGRVRKVEW